MSEKESAKIGAERGGAWSPVKKSDWPAGRQGDTDRRLPSIPGDPALSALHIY